MPFCLLLFLYFASTSFASDYDNYGSSSNTEMILDNINSNVTIANFLKSTSNTDTPKDWYKRDENGKEIKNAKNYQDNIIRILIDEITNNPSITESSRRIEALENIQEYLNEFINTHFIPKDMQPLIRKIYQYVKSMEDKPPFFAAAFIYQKLSQGAKDAFKSGRWTQTNSLKYRPQDLEEALYKPDPLLAEVLFLQEIITAQRISTTRKGLLDNINQKMQIFEDQLANEDNITMNNFDELRATLVEYANSESPIPALINYLLIFIKDKSLRSKLSSTYKKFLDTPLEKEWKELSHTSAKTHESLWKNVSQTPKNQEEDQQPKKPSFINNLTEKIKEGVEEKVSKGAENTASQTVEGLLSQVNDSLKEILPSHSGGSSTSSNITDSLGNILSDRADADAASTFSFLE